MYLGFNRPTHGAPCRTRTCGPMIKSHVLEPTQLKAHIEARHFHNNYKQLSILQNRPECLLVGQTFRRHKCRILAIRFGSYYFIALRFYSTTEQNHLCLIVIIMEAPSGFEPLTSSLPRKCTTSVLRSHRKSDLFPDIFVSSPNASLYKGAFVSSSAREWYRRWDSNPHWIEPKSIASCQLGYVCI